MKVKRYILPLTLLLCLFFFVKGYHLKSLKTTLITSVAEKGYEASVDKAWVKLNGKVVYKGIHLKDTAGTEIFINRLVIKSSVSNLLALQKELHKGTLESTQLARRIRRLSVDTLRGSYRGKSGGLFHIEDIRGRSRNDKLELSMTIPTAEHGKLSVHTGRVQASLQGDKIVLEKANFSLYEGAVTLSGEIDHLKELQGLSVAFRGISLESFFRSEKLSGICSGALQFDTLTLEDFSDIRRLHADGAIHISDFKEVGEVRFNTALKKLGKLGISSLNFDSITGDIELRGGRVVTENLTLTNSDYRLVAAGRYTIKRNSFNFTISGYLQPSMQDKMKPLIWSALILTDEGERKFTGSVRGVPEKYVVSVDGKIVKRGINSFFRNIFN